MSGNAKGGWRKCERCDEPFRYTRATRRFCSDRCRKAANREKKAAA
jgi:endogenous inhibitor of DNA gyrase (YacG/DUF329 family)